METTIITQPFELTIHGFSATVIGKDYSGTAFRLMDEMWRIVKGGGIENKGCNVWVYDADEKLFAGVELVQEATGVGLEKLELKIVRYAYYKHTGPYSRIADAGRRMRYDMKQAGFDVIFPYVEIYGHWSNDEAKLETELLMRLK